MVGSGIEEGIDEADRLVHTGTKAGDRVITGHRYRFGQHRMAEAIDGMRELGRNGRINRDVIGAEHVDVRRQLAREFAEYHVLVFHLGDELRRLEDVFARPCSATRVDVVAIGVQNVVACLILLEEGHDLLHDHAVVLGMENVVNGRQGDVLISAAVARHEVGIQQGSLREIGEVSPDRVERTERTMGYVVEEGVADGLKDEVAPDRLELRTSHHAHRSILVLR